MALCQQPGAPVSRLARECGVNANQVGRWLREHGHGRRPRRAVAGLPPTPAAFVTVPVLPASPTTAGSDDEILALVTLQTRLRNGVAIDLRGLELRNSSFTTADTDVPCALPQWLPEQGVQDGLE